MNADSPPKLVLTDPLPVLPPAWWQDWRILAGLAAGLLVLAALALAAKILLRRRPPTPGAVALAALENARDAVTVTRILRDYLAAVAPALHAGLTVEELSGHAAKPPAEGWPAFLRECDAAKYAGAAAPDDLAGRARELLITSERNLAATAAKGR